MPGFLRRKIDGRLTDTSPHQSTCLEPLPTAVPPARPPLLPTRNLIPAEHLSSIEHPHRPSHRPTTQRPIPAPSMMLCRPARGTVSLHRHRLCLQYTTAATATTAPSWSSSLRPRIVRGGGATSPAGTPGLMQPCPRPHPLTARCYGTDSSGTHRARAGANHSPATPTRPRPPSRTPMRTRRSGWPEGWPRG